MPIFVEKLETVAAAFAGIGEKLAGPGVLEAFQDLGNDVADTARANAPEYEGPPRDDITPGKLKSQIRARAARDLATGAPYVYVGVPWYYGGFLEFGTEHNAAHPFLRPAGDEWAPQVEDRIASAIATLLE